MPKDARKLAAAEKALAAVAAGDQAKAAERKARAAKQKAAKNQRAVETLELIETFIGPNRKDNAQRYRQYFEQCDTSGDGVLQRDEVAAAVAAIAEDLKMDALSSSKIGTLFAKCDANGDGVLSIDEWKRVYELLINGALAQATATVEEVRAEQLALQRKQQRSDEAAQRKQATQEAADEKARQEEEAAQREHLRRQEEKARSAPFVGARWRSDAERLKVADDDRARRWYPRGHYSDNGRDVLKITCDLDPMRDGANMDTWRERLPSTGRWRVFYVDFGDAEVPLAEAHELVDKFRFVVKYSRLCMDRSSFSGGEQHYWPPECPGGNGDYFNSG